MSYEPIGPSIFPDFAVGKNIAVEATLLVKLIGELKLETVFPSTVRTLKNAIEDVKFDGFHASRFVELDVTFPIDARSARRALKVYLRSIAAKPCFLIKPKKICDNLVVGLRLASDTYETPFRLGGIDSPNFVGWTNEEIIEQSINAIKRKNSKVSAILGKYKDVWLAVGSNRTIDLDIFSLEGITKGIRDALDIDTDFSSLILIDELNPARSHRLVLNRSS